MNLSIPNVTTQMKLVEQYFPTALFVFHHFRKFNLEFSLMLLLLFLRMEGLVLLNTYHTLLQTRWTPRILFSILRLLCIVSFFQFPKVVTDVSHRGVFRKQAVYHQFMGLFFCTFDIMLFWFTLACLADFPVSEEKKLSILCARTRQVVLFPQ